MGGCIRFQEENVLIEISLSDGKGGGGGFVQYCTNR